MSNRKPAKTSGFPSTSSFDPANSIKLTPQYGKRHELKPSPEGEIRASLYTPVLSDGFENLPVWEDVCKDFEESRDVPGKNYKYDFSTINVVSELLSVLPVFKGDVIERAASISATVANVISLANSILVYTKVEHLPLSVKISNTAALLSSVFALTTTLYNIVRKHTPRNLPKDFHEQVANEIIQEVLESKSEYTSNSGWSVVTSLTTMASILLSFVSGFSPSLSKTLIEKSKLITSGNVFKKCMDDVIKMIAIDVLGMDLNGDRAHIEKLKSLYEEAIFLNESPFHHFAARPDLVERLNQINKDISDHVDKNYASISASNTAKTYISLISHIRADLIQKKQLIAKKFMKNDRQTCVGVLLSGEPGVGKSSFINYIAIQLNKYLGYNPDIYSLNKRNGYYQPYSMESIGVYNELGASATVDNSLADLNEIVSSDPFNFEGADLPVKNQPCAIKVAMFTSNAHTPNFTPTLVRSSCEAFLSRMMRIRVADPLCEGRNQPNQHRKPDFSHLKLQICGTSSLNDSDQQQHMRDITVSQLIALIISQCAHNENQFVERSIPKWYDDPKIEARHRHMQKLITHYTPNAVKGTYFVVRFQGTLGTGKTTVAAELVESMRLKSLPLSKVDKNAWQVHPYPCLYLVDDLLHVEGDYVDYFSFINAIHPDSMVVLCSNLVIPRKQGKTCNLLKIVTGVGTSLRYEITEKNLPGITRMPGLARRLGLPGVVKVPKSENIVTSPQDQMCYTFTATGIQSSDNKAVIPGELIEDILAKYDCHVAGSVNYSAENQTPPVDYKYDIRIDAKSIAALQDATSSPAEVLKVFSGFHSSVKIEVDMKVYDQIKNTMTCFTELFPDDLKNVQKHLLFERINYAAKRYAMNLVKRVPGISIYLNIQNFGCFALKDGMYYRQNFENDINLEIFSDHVEVSYKYVRFRSTWEELADFYTGTITFPGLPSDGVVKLRAYLDRNKKLMPHYHINLEQSWFKKNTLRLQNTTKFMDFVRNPLVLSIGALIAGVTVTTFLYKWVKAVQADETKANSKGGGSGGASEDYANWSKTHEFAKKYVKAINNKPVRDQIRADVQAAGLSEYFNQWEMEWRSNSVYDPTTVDLDIMCCKIHKYFHNLDLDSISKMITQSPSYMRAYLTRHFSSRPNMVLQTDAIKHNAVFPIDEASRILAQSMVRVDSLIGSNYGIAFKDKLIVTVSHAFAELGERASVTENGVTYEAKCVCIERTRDLAVLHVTSKHYPAKRDIIKHFASHDDLFDMTEGTFMRLLNGSYTHVSSQISFHPESYTLTDRNNKYYVPERDILKMHHLNAKTISQVFKDGDCGFPLVNLTESGFSVIGIHNGYSYSGTGCFSTVTRDLLSKIDSDFSKSVAGKKDKFVSNALLPKPEMYKIAQHPHFPEVESFATPTEYLDALDDFGMSKFMGVSPEFPAKGYFPKLRFYSKPKNDKFYKPICPEIDFPQQYLPSAITLEHVKDTSALIRDRQGVPSTLVSQCALFKKEVTGEPIDEECFTLAAEFVKLEVMDISERGGTRPKILTLHEALNGFKKLNPLCMSSSAGPLLKMKYKIDTKRPAGREDILFGFSEKGYFINKESPAGRELLDRIVTGMAYIEDGQPLFVLAKDNAKVELLPAEKVAIGKVRLFSELDLDINIILKRYFGHQLNSIYENNLDGPMKMGINFYTAATYIARKYNKFDGLRTDTDYKNLDKFISSHLIDTFVNIFLYWCTEKERNAISIMLRNRYHVVDGTLYPVKRGNVSGSFITTLLNCCVLLLVLAYVFVMKHKQVIGALPSYSDYKHGLIKDVLGDDGIAKWAHYLGVDFEFFQKCALSLGLLLTPAKAQHKEEDLSFCSRVFQWDEKLQICFPALKKESVHTQLYYGNDSDLTEVLARLNIAMFEACLHEEEYFNRVRGICMYKARSLNLYDHCDWWTYAQYRTYFVRYVRNETSTPYSQVKANLNSKEVQEELDHPIFHFLKFETLNPNSQKHNFNMSNYVTRLFEHCQKNGITIRSHQDALTGTPEAPFRVELIITTVGGEQTFQACGKNIKQARAEAAKVALTTLGLLDFSKIEVVEKLLPNSNSQLEPLSEEDPLHGKMKELVLTDKLEKVSYVYSDGIHGWKAKITRKDKDVQITKSFVLIKPTIPSKSNSDRNVSVEPTTMNSAAAYIGASRLPVGSETAQPVAMTPAMGPPGEAINATVELVESTTLNPIGAPNMLPVGGIGFDVKDLVYTTFLDRDVEIDITNESPSGTVLLQIPYGVDTSYTNQYIKAYAQMHERYSGALTYRLTVMGNQLYSGAIGVAWYPRKILATTVPISELQKYSWMSKGVQMPWTTDMVLHDARQDLFYRRVSDDAGSLDDRPHLIVFLFVSVKNPYDASSTVRMRIASKLNAKGEPNPFEFSNPELGFTDITPSTTSDNVVDLVNIYKHFNNYDAYIYTDGRSATSYNYSGMQANYYSTALQDMYMQGIPGVDGSGVVIQIPSQAKLWGSRVWPTRASLIGDWPEYSTRVPATPNPSRFAMGIKAITTMDPNSFGRVMQLCPFAKSSFNYTTASFELCKDISKWVEPDYGVERPKVLSILWNDIFNTVHTEAGPSSKTYYSWVTSTWKVVTNKGIIIFCTVLVNYGEPSGEHPGVASFFTSRTDKVEGPNTAKNFVLDLPYVRLEQNSSALSSDLTILPLGYNKLDITTIVPSVISVNSYVGPTSTLDVTIGKDFSVYDELPLSECVQFDLIDVRSNVVMATVRYLQEYKMFVINKKYPNQTDYKLLPIDSAYVGILRKQVISRGLEFNVTDTSLWFDRTSPTAMRNGNALKRHHYNIISKHIDSKSNAMAAMAMGGGAIEGIGKGLNAHADRKFQQKMQGNVHQQQKDLFNMHSDLSLNMQSNSFDFQKLMQQGQFTHNIEMAEINKQNTVEINRESARSQQLARGMENRLLSMPGSSFA